MKWLLIGYILSIGQYQETFISENDCKDALIEAQLIRGPDLWVAKCFGPDDEITSQISTDIGP